MTSHFRETKAEQLQRLVQLYRESGNPWPVSALEVAKWAISNRHWLPRKHAAERLFAREISDAMRLEYHTDPQGRRVRTKRPFRIKVNEELHTLWGDWRSMDEWQASLAVSQVRAQIAGECKQLKKDVDSYNENNKPKKHIQLYLDFTDDADEGLESNEYAYGRVS